MRKTKKEIDIRNAFVKLAYPDRTNDPLEICQMTGLTPDGLRHLAVKLNITKRHGKFIHAVDDDFFKKWTWQMAYILGYITADGNIQKDRDCLDIAIHEKDRCFLEFMKKEMHFVGNINFRKKKKQVRLTICSSEIKRDLINLGVVPNKTKIEYIPKTLPEDLFWDYLRGLFDGDGCACRDELNIVSASKLMIETIEHKVGFGLISTTYKKPYLNPLYKWSVYSKINRQFIYNKFYGENHFCLERKKSIIAENMMYKKDKIQCVDATQDLLAQTILA